MQDVTNTNLSKVNPVAITFRDRHNSQDLLTFQYTHTDKCILFGSTREETSNGNSGDT